MLQRTTKYLFAKFHLNKSSDLGVMERQTSEQLTNFHTFTLTILVG